MPAGARPRIHDRLMMLRARGVRELDELAGGVQDLWPGAGVNHVRGALKAIMPRSNSKPNTRGPWVPGTPKPGVSNG